MLRAESRSPGIGNMKGLNASERELIIQEHHVAPNDWDEWLEMCGPYAGVRQTKSWAIQYDAEFGGNSYFLENLRAGVRRAGLLAHWVPGHGRFRQLKRLGERLAGLRYSRVEVFDGPATLDGDVSEVLPLIARLDAVARKHRAAGIRLAWFAPGYELTAKSPLHRVLVGQGYQRVDWSTSVVSLKDSEEAAFSRLRDKERSAIRKCEANGVRLHECANENDFLKYFVESYYGKDAKYLDMGQKQWRATSSKYNRYFVAMLAHDQVLATLATLRFNGYVTIRKVKRTKAGKESRLSVQDFLHWRVMNAHRDLGDCWFDLAGLSPAPSNDKERGISFFKAKWKGQTKLSPRYYKDLRPGIQRRVPYINKMWW